MSFSIGQCFSVIDEADGHVRKCKVVAINQDEAKVQIHYINWSSSLDEWLDFDSGRIRIDIPGSNPTNSGRREVMGALFLDADEISEQVLSSYPIDSSSDDKEKSLSKFSVSHLENCAKLLKIALKDSTGKKLFNKKSLVIQMILCIESLMPAQCEECSSTYRINIGDQPLFKCHICLRGSHNCDQLKKMSASLSNLRVAGIIWLCGSCSVAHSGTPPLIGDVSPPPVNIVETSNSAAEGGPTVDVRNPPIVNGGPIPQQGGVAAVICKKYKKGNCPHGLRGNKLVNGQKCPHQHPRSCNKFCAFGSRGPRGCNRGASCQYFHPMLCRLSLRSRECTNEKCTFVHLKGTIRKPAAMSLPPESGPNSVESQVRNRDQSSTPSPFLKLENLIEQMDSRYQQQITQLQSQLDVILRAGVAAHPQRFDPVPYCQHQMYQSQQRPPDPYQVMAAQAAQGQTVLNPSFAQVAQRPLKDLSQRNTPQLSC